MLGCPIGLPHTLGIVFYWGFAVLKGEKREQALLHHWRGLACLTQEKILPRGAVPPVAAAVSLFA